jgi:ribosomal protein L40E
MTPERSRIRDQFTLNRLPVDMHNERNHQYWTCPECGAENEKGADTCSECEWDVPVSDQYADPVGCAVIVGAFIGLSMMLL